MPADASNDGCGGFLARVVKASGWAVPVSRRVEDFLPESLFRMVRLSEEGVPHLFAEDDGVFLDAGQAGSTTPTKRAGA